MVALPYSSGTTGLPKGVMLTHKGLVTSIAQQVDGENPNLYFHQEDVILCVLPLFHIYSLNSVLLCGLRAKAAILLMPKFEINALLGLVHKHRVTVAAVVPPIVLAIARSPDLHRYDLSSIRILKSGGAPLGKELEDTVRAKFPNAILGQVATIPHPFLMIYLSTVVLYICATFYLLFSYFIHSFIPSRNSFLLHSLRSRSALICSFFFFI